MARLGSGLYVQEGASSSTLKQSPAKTSRLFKKAGKLIRGCKHCHMPAGRVRPEVDQTTQMQNCLSALKLIKRP